MHRLIVVSGWLFSSLVYESFPEATRQGSANDSGIGHGDAPTIRGMLVMYRVGMGRVRAHHVATRRPRRAHGYGTYHGQNRECFGAARHGIPLSVYCLTV
jgi:hypothetical protein